MYATGDRARWREEGVLELLGRRDDQVKVRGFRVELAEVEAAIAACPGVREAALIVQHDAAGGPRLIACVVGSDGKALPVDAVRRMLGDRLPRPMIPSRFHIVAELPRTPSGKVDRRALAECLPDEFRATDVTVPARNPVEEQLVAIWEDLLQVRPIGVTDDFFDLGGHSLLAARLAARIEERFGRSIALSDLLKSSTIEALASRLSDAVKSPAVLPVVDLGAAGAGAPLFLVHPIGGGILCYRGLARCFDGVRGVLGLQALGLEGDTEPETDLVRMASRYVDALRIARPEGPYFLGGWSMGGVVAFEMARQLTAEGQEVPLVFLIDCSVPGRRRTSRPLDDHESLMAFAADLARTAGARAMAELEPLRALGPESIRDGTFERVIKESDLARQIGPDRIRRLHEAFRANWLALDGYEPRPYSGRAVLVRAARERAARARYEAGARWRLGDSQLMTCRVTITRSCKARPWRTSLRCLPPRSNAANARKKRFKRDESPSLLVSIVAQHRDRLGARRCWRWCHWNRTHRADPT